MSLKGFHCLFIVIAIIITGGFAYWAIADFTMTKKWLTLLLGLGSTAAALGLMVYFFWFLRKAKGLPS